MIHILLPQDRNTLTVVMRVLYITSIKPTTNVLRLRNLYKPKVFFDYFETFAPFASKIKKIISLVLVLML